MSGERAYIYVRVSSARQEEEGSSLETQEDSCRVYCEQHGWTVVGIERDTFTGTELWERPGLNRLRDRMRDGEFDIVVVHALDRLSRDQNHQAYLIVDAENRGVRYESATEDIDGTPTGQLLRAVYAFKAQQERIDIIERTMRGRRKAVQDGRMPHGSKPRYGYQWDAEKKWYQVDPETAPIVRRIFDMAEQGIPLRRIASILTEEGIPTPMGKQVWKMSSIRQMLRHPFYCGNAVAWRTQRVEVIANGKKRKREVLRPPEENIMLPEEAVPALISQEQWDRVQERLRQNKLQASRNNRRPQNTLLRSGYVVCGYCGRTMHASVSKGEERYRCPGDGWITGTCQMPSIQANLLDDAVWKHVSWMLSHPQIIMDQIDKLVGDDPTEHDLKPVEETLANVQRRIEGLIRQISLMAAETDDEYATSLLRAELSKLSAQKTRMEADRAELLTRREQWEAVHTSSLEFTRLMERVGHDQRNLDYTGKRQRLDLLGVRVKVYKTDDPEHERYVVETNLDLDWWVEAKQEAWRYEDAWRAGEPLPAGSAERRVGMKVDLRRTMFSSSETDEIVDSSTSRRVSQRPARSTSPHHRRPSRGEPGPASG